MSYARTERRRQHGARSTADCTKLSDGRTAMKNTDAVFVRRRAGRGGHRTAGKRADGVFPTDFRLVFARDHGPRRLRAVTGENAVGKRGKMPENIRYDRGTAHVRPLRTGSFLPLGDVRRAAWRMACPTTTTCSFRIHWCPTYGARPFSVPPLPSA